MSKRKKDETFVQYKKRRKQEQLKLKYYLKGTIFWDSYFRGTYRRDITKS